MPYFTRIHSPIGILTLKCNDEGEQLQGLWIAGQRFHGDTSQCTYALPTALPVLAQAKLWLQQYFAGKKPSPDRIAIDASGTAFQRQVWQLLSSIHYGQTATYGKLAQQMTTIAGHLIPAQAVGAAVGHNPIAIIVPCHRVIGSNGSLTGFAAGIDIKRRLLQLEAAQPDIFQP